MNEKNKRTIPENFSSIEEAAEFWDSHSLTDFDNELTEVEIDVRTSRQQWIPVATSFSEQIAALAKKEGVSVETLVNLWISEKLQAA